MVACNASQGVVGNLWGTMKLSGGRSAEGYGLVHPCCSVICHSGELSWQESIKCLPLEAHLQGDNGPHQDQSLFVIVPRVRWIVPQACTTACSPAHHSSEDWSEHWRGPPTDWVGKRQEEILPIRCSKFSHSWHSHTADILNSQWPQQWLLTLFYCGLGIIWAFQGNHGY